MAASLFSSGATGAGFELAFSNFQKIILDVIRENVNFAPTLRMIIETMKTIDPKFKRIKAYNEDSDRPDDTEWLEQMMKKGENLVLKCSKIHRHNFLKKPLYTKKLRKFDEDLRRYISIYMPVENAADIKETLFEVKSMSLKFGNMSMTSSSFGGSSIGTSSFGGSSMGTSSFGGSSMGTPSFGGSSKSSVVRICSPPGLKVSPVGLEIPLKEMKDKLLNLDSVSQVNVVSALGGCGKTTLALALCQDHDILEKFKDNIFFVTVSKSPSLQIIIERLFQHVKDMVPGFLSEEDATNQLEKLLRFSVEAPILLVLDDVWSGAEPIIEKLKFPIKGYKILVTSRFEFPRFGPSYKLPTLKKADAMTLFQSQAFLPNVNSYEPDKDDLNKIVEACKGFPLAISVVGKSLCGKSAVEWRKRVKECSKASSILADSELLKCLQSSIDALDDNRAAKECYLDLGCFPEDHKIPANTLVDLWVEAHNLDEEDAILSLHELSNRNLIDQIPLRKDASEDYGSLYVSQHDLLRELAIIQSSRGSIEHRKRLFIEITQDEMPGWLIQQGQQLVRANLLSINTSNNLHLADKNLSSIWGNIQAPFVEVLVLNFHSMLYALPQFVTGMAKLKVLVVANNGFSAAELSNFEIISSLFNLKRIRLERISLPSSFFSTVQLDKLEKISLVMCSVNGAFSNLVIWMPNLKEINIDSCKDLHELPEEFCELVLLKQLSITNCHNLISLPEEIGNLENLEVLRLNSCIALKELPNSIVKLRNLRSLDISNCFDIELPEGMGELSNLRKVYMVDCCSCRLPWSIVSLENLREVIGDEETANSWREFKEYLPNLDVKVHKDINLNWLH